MWFIYTHVLLQTLCYIQPHPLIWFIIVHCPSPLNLGLVWYRHTRGWVSDYIGDIPKCPLISLSLQIVSWDYGSLARASYAKVQYCWTNLGFDPTLGKNAHVHEAHGRRFLRSNEKYKTFVCTHHLLAIKLGELAIKGMGMLLIGKNSSVNSFWSDCFLNRWYFIVKVYN